MTLGGLPGGSEPKPPAKNEYLKREVPNDLAAIPAALLDFIKVAKSAGWESGSTEVKEMISGLENALIYSMSLSRGVQKDGVSIVAEKEAIVKAGVDGRPLELEINAEKDQVYVKVTFPKPLHRYAKPSYGSMLVPSILRGFKPVEFFENQMILTRERK